MKPTIHEGLAPNLAAAVIVLGIFAFSTFGLRVYTRVTRRSWGPEDSMMAFATLPLFALLVSTAVGCWKGLGVSDSVLALPGNEGFVETGFFCFFLFQIFFCISIIPVKLSIALMLNRIASGRKKWLLWANYTIMALCTASNLASAIYIIFRCSPVRAAWDAELMGKPGLCQPDVILQDIYWMDTAVNIFTDWATALMPIPLLWNVQMNLQTKLSTGAILGLGIFASLSGCIRLAYTINLTSQVDYLHGVANIIIWGCAEPSIGMIVGNLATLRPLLRRLLRSGTDDHSSGPSHGRYPGPAGSGGVAHRYKTFDKSFGADFEMGQASTYSKADENGGKGLTSTQIRSGGSLANTSHLSISSEAESQKQILDVTEETGSADSPHGGITVSRQVHVKSMAK